MRTDWIEITLGEIGKVISGGTPKTIIQEYWGNEISWVTPADLSGYTKKYISSGRKNITKLGLAKSSAKLMPKNSVLFSTRAPIGYVAIAENDIATNQGFKSIVPYSIINSEYLFYYLKSIINIAEKQSSGTTFKELSAKAFSNLPCKLPPLPEQRAIVAKLEQLFSELDKGIANLKKAKAQLEIYRQAVLKKAFEGELTKEWRELNNIDSDWEMMSLGDIGNWRGGGTPSKSKPEYWENGTVLWVSPKDMKFAVINSTIDRITEESIDNSSAKWIDKGAILIVVRSGIIRRMLPVAIAGQNLTVNQDLQTIKPSENFSSEFVYWFFIANDRDIRNNCAKDGTTVDNINVPVLKKHKIKVPSLNEQIQIVQEIESRLSVCDNILATIEENLEKSEALRQSLLKKAFEGKLLSEAELEACRKETDWEPAEKLLERIKNEKM